MKSLKSLFILLLLTVSMGATAQTTLKEAFKAFLKANPSGTTMNPETMRNAFELMNSGIIKDYDKEKSVQLIDKYLKEEFWNDAIDGMLPFIEDKLNVDEVNELTAKLLTKEGSSYQEHWSKINANANFEKIGSDLANNIIGGEDPAPIQPIDCPAEYKQLFEQFFKESGNEKLFTSMFDGLSSSTTGEQSTMMDKVKTYIMDNASTLILNESYGTLTEDDMRFGLELFKSQAYQNQMKAMSSIMSNAQELGMSIVMKYLTWLQGQGVETKM